MNSKWLPLATASIPGQAPDVMSAAPYPEFPAQKIKLAMALGDKGYYRLSQVQLRYFSQSGQKAGLHEQDMESIFSDLAARMEGAIAEAAALAVDANMPVSTSGPILAGVNKRAGIIGTRK